MDKVVINKERSDTIAAGMYMIKLLFKLSLIEVKEVIEKSEN